MPDRDQRFTQEPIAPELQVEQSSSPIPATANGQTMHPKNQLHLFSSFCEYPDRIAFREQEEDGEEILLFLRKSHIVNLHWIIGSFILLLLPVLLFLLPQNAFPFRLPIALLFILLSLYYLLTITYAFVNFFIWYYNAALITNERIVDIDFHQLIIKNIAETKLALVQDVSYRQQSVMENLFDYGHILIQTAGTIDNFEFNSLPHPERIEEIVNRLIRKKMSYVS